MESTVLKLDAPGALDEAVAAARESWSRGELVVFPTETVYGVGAQVDAAGGWDRLVSAKQRPAEKAFTLHVGRQGAIERYTGRLGLRSRVFLRKALPGPVTVVFELSEGQWAEVGERLGAEVRGRLYHNRSIGIRLPDHAGARALLNGASGPVVASSANGPGAAAPTSFEEAWSAMGGYAAVGLDGGETRYSRASTVVRVRGEEIEVLREGVLDAGAIERMRTVRIVVVCTGNSCRSPMGEAFLSAALAERLGCRVDELGGRGYIVESAGTSAAPGMSASPESVSICSERGLDISGHQAQLMTGSLLGRSDVVLVMEESHRRLLESMGARAGQVMLLCSEGAVADPIGQGMAAYRRCAQQIERCVRSRLEELM